MSAAITCPPGFVCAHAASFLDWKHGAAWPPKPGLYLVGGWDGGAMAWLAVVLLEPGALSLPPEVQALIDTAPTATLSFAAVAVRG